MRRIPQRLGDGVFGTHRSVPHLLAARHFLLDYDVALNAAGLDAWLRRAG